jgi:hypothetical protein
VKPQVVAWLWTGRLALGKLAMLDADPGVGKSLLTLELCARLSTGRPFPDDASTPVPASCLLLSAEDGDQDTVLPRLRALGADLARVFLLPREDPKTGMPLRFPGHVRALAENLKRTRARLVVIDPIVAFLAPSINTSNDQSVRRALYPLARLAEKQRCVILLVRHLNKIGGARSLYRGGGSIGFAGACRSVWLLGRDPSSPQRRVLAQVKNNLAPPQASLAFDLTAADEVGPGGEKKAARAPGLPLLTWNGPSPLSADDLLGGPIGLATEAGESLRAMEFLTRMLKDGPRSTRFLWQHAEAEGLGASTLHRAREKLRLGIRRTWEAGQPVSYWSLRPSPGAGAPADDPLPPENRALEDLRKCLPPPTPLDKE